MFRISTIFIAVCMMLIASSIGASVYYLLALDITQSALIASAALTVLILYNAVAARLRDRTDVGAQIADLSRGTADLGRQVAEFGRRLASIEQKLASGDGHTRAAITPLAAEIGELGSLVNQLAMTVAAHDERLASGSQTMRPAENLASSLSVAAASSEFATAMTGRATGITGDIVRTAIEANRLDLYLQPLVTLPQRKVRYYEAISRLRDASGTVFAATDFLGAAEQGGLMPRIDHMVVFRCVQVLRRLMAKNKDMGLFCNLSRQTLNDAAIFRQCLDFLDANRALAPAMVFEVMQSSLRNLNPVESEHLAALAQRGFRFSVDHVTDLKIDARELADRGVKFIKVAAPLLLDPSKASDTDIHPADLSDLLGRFGIDLVAERIEGEKAVVDLLDYDVRYGQGFLFSPPRPLRPEAETRPGEPAASAASPTGTAALVASASHA